MHCYICEEPSIGQCQACWKFYCKMHGDIVCQQCHARVNSPDTVKNKFAGWEEGTDKDLSELELANDVAANEPHSPSVFEDMKEPNALERVVHALGRIKDAFTAYMIEPNELERVVPIAQTVEYSGTELTVLSLEIYDNGFALHHRVRLLWGGRTSPGSDVFPPHPEVYFKITDNLGNRYQGIPSSGGGNSRQWRGETHWGPRINPRATALNIRVEQILWSSHGTGQRPRIQEGPWEFEIPLS